MAYALALESVNEPLISVGGNKLIGNTILYMTVTFALFTILGVGSVLNPLLERLNVKQT